jgi:hypothetical protein
MFKPFSRIEWTIKALFEVHRKPTMSQHLIRTQALLDAISKDPLKKIMQHIGFLG